MDRESCCMCKKSKTICTPLPAWLFFCLDVTQFCTTLLVSFYMTLVCLLCVGCMTFSTCVTFLCVFFYLCDLFHIHFWTCMDMCGCNWALTPCVTFLHISSVEEVHHFMVNAICYVTSHIRKKVTWETFLQKKKRHASISQSTPADSQLDFYTIGMQVLWTNVCLFLFFVLFFLNSVVFFRWVKILKYCGWTMIMDGERWSL